MHCSCSFPAVFFIALGIFLFIRWMKKVDRASLETAERMYDPTRPDAHSPDLLAEVSRPPPEIPPPPGATKPVCPVCNDAIEGESTVCPWCHAAHHPECFSLNDGCGECEFTTKR